MNYFSRGKASGEIRVFRINGKKVFKFPRPCLGYTVYMSVRKYSFVPGEFYHIYNQGNDKRVIYKDPPDYERFMELLFLSNSRERITVKDIKNLHTFLITNAASRW